MRKLTNGEWGFAYSIGGALIGLIPVIGWSLWLSGFVYSGKAIWFSIFYEKVDWWAITGMVISLSTVFRALVFFGFL